MSVAVSSEPGTLLAELRSLCARLPVPQPDWHPYVSLIAACREDFERAVELAAERPAVLDLVAEIVDGGEEPEFDPDADPELAAAWQRLETLPVPEGQHPYLDEILPALEALRALLVALSHAGAG